MDRFNPSPAAIDNERIDLLAARLHQLPVKHHHPVAGDHIGYRRDIDGLRAVSIVSVVLYHAGFRLVSGGFVGVDVFFVISGYLIGGIIWRGVRDGSFRYADFYARRLKRIVPALAFVLATLLVVGMLILTPPELSLLARGTGASLFGASNILFWMDTDYFAPDAVRNPLLMTWSLGVEEQFYLLLPLCLAVIGRLGRRTPVAVLLALSGASLGLCVWTTAIDPSVAFYWLPMRGWELGIGVALAVYEAEHGPLRLGRITGAASGAIGGAMIMSAVLLFDSATPFPGAAAALPAVGAAMVIATRHGPVRRFLAFRPIVFIGLVSYSWYLWHWPILAIMRTIANRSTSGHFDDLTFIDAATAVALSFLLAVLSWRFVERPFRRSGTAQPALFLRYGALAAALLIPALSIAAAHGLPARYTGSLVDPASLRMAQDRICLPSYGHSDLPNAPFCYGEGPGAAILGDSHAGALAPGLRDDLEHAGLSLTQLTKTSCPPLSGFAPRSPDHPRLEAECAAFNAAAVARIRNDSNIRTVILTAYWSAYLIDDGRAVVPLAAAPGATRAVTNAAALTLGVRSQAESLARAGKRVIVLTDVPVYRFNVAIEHAGSFIPLRRRLAEVIVGRRFVGDWVPRRYLIDDDTDSLVRAAVAGVPGVRVVSLKDRMCAGDFCRGRLGSGPLYRDEQHLNHAGAALLAPAIMPL